MAKGFFIFFIFFLIATAYVVFFLPGNKPAEKECVITGCSSQICAGEEAATSCEFLPEYECYKTAVCKKQADGQCGWTQTPELLRCLSEARK